MIYNFMYFYMKTCTESCFVCLFWRLCHGGSCFLSVNHVQKKTLKTHQFFSSTKTLCFAIKWIKMSKSKDEIVYSKGCMSFCNHLALVVNHTDKPSHLNILLWVKTSPDFNSTTWERKVNHRCLSKFFLSNRFIPICNINVDI